MSYRQVTGGSNEDRECLERSFANPIYDASNQPHIDQDSHDPTYEQLDDSDCSEHSFINSLYNSSLEQHNSSDSVTTSIRSRDSTVDHHYSTLEQSEQEHDYHVLNGPLGDQRETTTDKEESNISAVDQGQDGSDTERSDIVDSKDFDDLLSSS